MALLIGNSDYRSEESLTAPSHDVRTLTQIFQTLHFKVVALLNLTQREIQNIVNFFCELIDRNVYVVFYFCGHGFERHGNTFLVPTDARAGYSLPECVCTEEILESIQAKDPALIFMILDLCRKGLVYFMIYMFDKLYFLSQIRNGKSDMQKYFLIFVF